MARKLYKFTVYIPNDLLHTGSIYLESNGTNGNFNMKTMVTFAPPFRKMKISPLR